MINVTMSMTKDLILEMMKMINVKNLIKNLVKDLIEDFEEDLKIL